MMNYQSNKRGRAYSFFAATIATIATILSVVLPVSANALKDFSRNQDMTNKVNSEATILSFNSGKSFLEPMLNIVKTAVKVPPKPAKVTGVSVRTTKNSVTVTWNRVSGSNIRYEVYCNGEKHGDVTGTYFRHCQGVTPGTIHTMQIRAYTTYRGQDGKTHKVYGPHSIAIVAITDKK